mmetsp:Transcript_8582/g.24659  ORF Transcript_8582/g.24659 Transcript_8582/m.24659 type:complete len:100 (-) Transcript_8582:396-695(-)
MSSTFGQGGKARSLYRKFFRCTEYLDANEAAHVLSRIRRDFRLPRSTTSVSEALDVGETLLDNLNERCQHFINLLENPSFSADRLQAIKGVDTLEKWRR